MNSEITDDIVITILREILGKLSDIHGSIDALSLRIMAVTASIQRAEMTHDEVANDLAWSHKAAADVKDGSPPGSRADAASLPSPTEKWEN